MITESSKLEFDPATLPWIDTATDAEIAAYASSQPHLPGYDLASLLKKWRDDGYVAFERILNPALIDAYLLDFDEVTRARQLPLVVVHEKRGLTRLDQLTTEDMLEPHMRVVDFHLASIAGRKLGQHPVLTWFLSHAFRAPLVMKQSLTFKHGPEQWLHQDFAYVHTSIPSHLAGVWCALEDVHRDAGPFRFFPGSHRVPKFDFGNGLQWNSDSTRSDRDFGIYLEEQVAKFRWREIRFEGKKGDVVVWHSGLVHGSSPTHDRSLTRKSFVTHYSTAQSEGVESDGSSVHVRHLDEVSFKNSYLRGESI